MSLRDNSPDVLGSIHNLLDHYRAGEHIDIAALGEKVIAHKTTTRKEPEAVREPVEAPSEEYVDYSEKMNQIVGAYNSKIAALEGKLREQSTEMASKVDLTKEELIGAFRSELETIRSEMVAAQAQAQGMVAQALSKPEPIIHITMPSGKKKITRADGTVIGTMENE